jgi:hypothetical protein
MCKLLPALLLMGSALFAAPISITGTFGDGNDMHDLFFSGPGLDFHGASESGPIIYKFCPFYFIPCDLSDNFPIHFDCATPGNLCWSITYNGQNLIGPCAHDGCGVLGGSVEISAAPFLFDPNPCPAGCTTGDIPISLSGEISATYNNGVPLFDLLVSGTGTMTAFWSRTADAMPVRVALITGSFVGEATLPEPSTWVLLATGLLLTKFRKTHQVQSKLTGSVANSAVGTMTDSSR